MDKKLYDLMDWAGIEEMVYSEARHPENLLGRQCSEEGVFNPGNLSPTAEAVAVKILSTGKVYPMSLADDEGFFAALLPKKTTAAYTLQITYDNGSQEEVYDPYSFPSQFTDSDLKKICFRNSLPDL